MARVDAALEAARQSLRRRIEPEQLASAMREGALVVDTRSQAQRERDGELPGALVVERNVLEWRLDPTSPHRLPQLRDEHQQVVIVCDEGYASSLAAASLVALGLSEATDLVGGYQAWKRQQTGA